MKHMRKHVLKAILVVALLMVFVMPSFADVNNGGFETGDFTGWTTNYSGSSPYVPWTVTTAGFTDGFFLSAPNSGTFDALNGFDGDGPANYTMYQDVTATGDTGIVTFYYRAQFDLQTFCSGCLDRTLSVEVINPGSMSVLQNTLIYTATAGTIGDTGWTQASVSFPATSGSIYRIQFNEWIPEAFTGPALIEFDDISVVFTAGLNVPHVTDIRINAGSNVPAYDSAAGSQAKLSGGQDIFLPADYDGNGYDTYVVTDTAVVDGVTWYSIFLGNESFVWVNGSQVILQ